MSKAKETLLQVFLCGFSEVYLPGDLQDIYQWLLVLSVQQALCEKCPYSELFWPAFSRIRTEYVEILPSLRIQSECEKIWTRITPNTDTFYAVKIYLDKETFY